MKELVKTFGFVINRSLRHLLSFYRWAVFVRPLSPDSMAPENSGADDTVSFRLATDEDYQRVIEAYPAEFGGHLPEYRKRQELEGRRASGARCFVAVDTQGGVLGATWCVRTRHPLLKRVPLLGEKPAFEMVNTFVSSGHRGLGIGGALRRFALQSMVEAGFGSVISFVWYSREASLAMNLVTGSRIVGEKSQLSLLGWRREWFGTDIRVNNLPLGELPVLRLIHRDLAGRRSLEKWFRHSGVPVGPANPGADWISSCSNGQLRLYADTPRDCVALQTDADQRAAPMQPDLESAVHAPRVSLVIANGQDASGPGLSFRNEGIQDGVWVLEADRESVPPEWVHDAVNGLGSGLAIAVHGERDQGPVKVITCAFSLVRLIASLEEQGVRVCAALYMHGLGKSEIVGISLPERRHINLNLDNFMDRNSTV